MYFVVFYFCVFLAIAWLPGQSGNHFDFGLKSSTTVRGNTRVPPQAECTGRARAAMSLHRTVVLIFVGSRSPNIHRFFSPTPYATDAVSRELCVIFMNVERIRDIVFLTRTNNELQVLLRMCIYRNPFVVPRSLSPNAKRAIRSRKDIEAGFFRQLPEHLAAIVVFWSASSGLLGFSHHTRRQRVCCRLSPSSVRCMF